MERKYGYIASPKDLRDYKVNKVYKSISLPSEFVTTHSNIKDQGAVNSCVAHAVSEVLEAHDNINYSTGWIYGYRPFGYYQGEGMVTSQALKTINKVGYLENKDLDVNIEMNAAKEIVDKNLNVYKDKASHKRVSSYARLNTIDEIKYALYSSNKPILLAILVGTRGIELDKNNVAYIPEQYSGGHQMVCYGWNETGLLIQNSWGKSWGDKGTFVLPYEYPISEAWLIKFDGEVEDASIINKPALYLIKKLIMKIVKLFKKIFKK